MADAFIEETGTRRIDAGIAKRGTRKKSAEILKSLIGRRPNHYLDRFNFG